MGGDWPKVKIEEIQANTRGAIAIGPFGSRMKSDCYVESGIPVIRGTNITGGPTFEGDFVYISEDKADSLGSCNVYNNDLVFPHRGSIGEVGIITDDQRYVISSSLMKLTCDAERVNPKYLYYFFKSHIGKHELLKNASQVGTPGIGQPLSSLKAIGLKLPPIEFQNKAETILTSLDDKIELNRQMNATLEAMAQALFKSWFVDFDPVIDNALAAGNTIPEPLQAKAKLRAALGDKRKPLPEAIQKQFPNSFVFSEEMGWIPEGWEVLSLDALIELIGGGTPKTSIEEYWNGEIPWFSVVDAPRQADVFVLYTEKNITPIGLENSSAKLLPIGTTIISARGTVGKCAIVGEPMAMNQSCYGIRGVSGYSDYYVYYTTLLRVSDLQQSGHGSVFNTITRDTFRTIKTVACSSELSSLFDGIIRDNMERIITNLRGAVSLAAIRDTLLPKLLSGELRIPDAEKLVADNV